VSGVPVISEISVGTFNHVSEAKTSRRAAGYHVSKFSLLINAYPSMHEQMSNFS